MNFDYPQGISGDLTTAVLDTDLTPNLVLDKGLAFFVRVSWTPTGPGVQTLGGNWTIKAYAESLGPGPELQIGPSLTIPVVPIDGHAYSESISVPANTLLAEGEGAPPASGVYKLVVVVTHTNTLGTRTEMAGFAEGPVFEIRNP
jgi:hypothetical protein